MPTPLFVSSTADLLDNWSDPRPLHVALALASFADGTMPYCVSGIHLNDDVDAEAIASATGLSIVRHHQGHRGSRREVAFVGEDCAIAITVGGKDDVLVFATTEARTTEVADLVAALGEKAPEALSESQIKLALLYRNERWNESVSKTIEVPAWEEIRDNYAASSLMALDALMALEGPPPNAGALILLHGVPGTGKTTVLRSLARQWAPWCTTSYILDPNELLTQSSYLNSVIFDSRSSLRPAGASTDTKKWRLFIIEDADDILATGENVSKGLSQLLNLTDGLLGHEINVLFAITTNAKIATLHAALARPGRCLAEIDIPKLSTAEANAWLGPDYKGPRVTEPTTLAKLLDVSGRIHKISSEQGPLVRSGQYL